MAEKNASTVLVLIFGPPASGKTTLAANLKGRLSQCLLLSFDDIFSAEEQKVAIQTRGSLKILRRSMLEAVKDILDGRRECVSTTKIIDRVTIDQRKQIVKGPWQHIIIDDNLYLRSMRHCWFQAAKARGISLCNVYVTASLEECLDRNRLRPFPVPENVIINQFRKMEPPIAEASQAEKFSLSLKTSNFSMYINTAERLLTLIAAARLCPLVPQDVERTQSVAESSRRVTRESKSHNLDLAFRKAVTGLIKNEPCCRKKQQIWARSMSFKADVLSAPNLQTLSSQLRTALDGQRNDLKIELQTTIAATLTDKLSLQPMA
ncbi:L-seryl-tRNA(Sec) kinase-like isoform X2 [Varroa jacobsoni]|uniref:L-seryl-tRNA(Sec) kinase n=1 Tax=Varroa destructor TaxID=109461 RepID=A0A7M7MEV0_VARDE|nr:L-seryl-tRNA(Sec) kinase-like isoform X3 [Varroa destructor]XP_022671383.1 L-seryl-tRNA(Sec) kinase-like isoform X3 [Varroa destructor]XP_022671384.1 L-seryl-tRNA(Sec) kinase-like isoform X3 [Varroa destructor]XP_022671385.1 L-seryl-tRNA(Sec) kinase-like isoform X3 [Varroa destructor]XP_022671386.1 L-seryl-tRNA(Sec) kinase-like isoform X3 [Varroa destructor]XP_022671387.1 L-seryl-tRNA(Sec) kinase-like isoform X3 [Varroa destructor]XP_022687106.1 L-seryl-tRNA(Sec) kinase-like isoform X2 [Va